MEWDEVMAAMDMEPSPSAGGHTIVPERAAVPMIPQEPSGQAAYGSQMPSSPITPTGSKAKGRKNSKAAGSPAASKSGKGGKGGKGKKVKGGKGGKGSKGKSAAASKGSKGKAAAAAANGGGGAARPRSAGAPDDAAAAAMRAKAGAISRPRKNTKKTLMTEVYQLARQLNSVRDKLGESLELVDLTHSKLLKETAGTSDYMCRKLKTIYESVVVNSELEEDLLAAMALAVNKTLTEIAKSSAGAGARLGIGSKSQSSMVNSIDSTLPTWPGTHPLKLCGSIPAAADWPIPPGHQVAALVSKTKEDARWILGVITAFDDEKERYTVEDIMEDVTAMQSAQASAPERYQLTRSKIQPLPRWLPRPGLKGSFFESGTQVLALYPQTTCFYPAVIHEPPTPDRMNTYSMRFYDDDYPDGRARYQEVPVKFVVVKPKR